MTEPMMITREMRDSRAEKASKIIENINRDIKRASEKACMNAILLAQKTTIRRHLFTKKSEKDSRATATGSSQLVILAAYGSILSILNGR